MTDQVDTLPIGATGSGRLAELLSRTAYEPDGVQPRRGSQDKGKNGVRAIGYCRVSTEEQAREGVSLDAQQDKIRAYAALFGYELAGVVEDAGVSAKTLRRPGMNLVFAELDARRADGLIVTKLDRLTRSVRDWATLIETRFGPNGAELFSVGDAIDTTKAAGRLVLNVLMSVAQWEREVISERTAEALAHKRTRGERIGQIPYGWMLDADGVRLIPDRAESAAIAEIRDLAAKGLPPRAIARSLDAIGHCTKNGGTWNESTIRRILKSQGKPCPS